MRALQWEFSQWLSSVIRVSRIWVFPNWEIKKNDSASSGFISVDFQLYFCSALNVTAFYWNVASYQLDWYVGILYLCLTWQLECSLYYSNQIQFTPRTQSTVLGIWMYHFAQGLAWYYISHTFQFYISSKRIISIVFAPNGPKLCKCSHDKIFL